MALMDSQPMMTWTTHPRYVVATLPSGAYVVYDRWDARVADGRYLALVDAQWAADQRNQTFAAAQRQQMMADMTTEPTPEMTGGK